MGKVYADVEVINLEEVGLARRGHMDPDEVKRMQVRVLVDSGAMLLCINENLQKYFQLPVIDKKTYYQANDGAIECDVVGPVEIRFKGKYAFCNAIVLPGDSEPLLGMIPLKLMDVLIDPVRLELVNPETRTDIYRLPTIKDHPGSWSMPPPTSPTRPA